MGISRTKETQKISLAEQLERRIILLALRKVSRKKLCEILHRSQSFLALWNHGKTNVYWNDFILITNLLNFDLSKAFFRIGGFREPTERFHEFVKNLWPHKSLHSDVQRILSMSRSTAHRLLNGKQDIKLKDFFTLLDEWNFLDPFCEELNLDIRTRPTKQKFFENERNRLFNESPEFSFVSLCHEIGLSNFKSLSQQIDLSEENLVFLHSKLAQLLELPRIPKTDAKTERVNLPSADNGARLSKLAVGALKRRIDMRHTDPKKRFIGTTMTTCSSETLEKIRKTLTETHVKICNLIDAESGKVVKKKHMIATVSGFIEFFD